MSKLIDHALKQMADQGRSVHSMDSIVASTLANIEKSPDCKASWITGAVIEAFKLGVEFERFGSVERRQPTGYGAGGRFACTYCFGLNQKLSTCLHN